MREFLFMLSVGCVGIFATVSALDDNCDNCEEQVPAQTQGYYYRQEGGPSYRQDNSFYRESRSNPANRGYQEEGFYKEEFNKDFDGRAGRNFGAEGEISELEPEEKEKDQEFETDISYYSSKDPTNLIYQPDQDIVAKIDRILKDSSSNEKYANVVVYVADGNVRLTGSVKKPADKEAVRRKILSVPGVQRIDDSQLDVLEKTNW